MKWKNKGHEFDGVYQNICQKKRFMLFGAGDYGHQFFPVMHEEIEIIGYIDNVSDLIYLIPYGSLGVCFALLYYKTDNIFSSIVVHSLHNSIAIFLYLVMGGVI